MFFNNKMYLLEYVKYSDNYINIPSIFKNDKEILLQAIKYNIFYYPIEFASDKLKNDKEIILRSIKQNSLLLKYASK